MATTSVKKTSEVDFWKSRKFWFTVLGMLAFLALAISKTMHFTNQEAMTIILALVLGNVGAHTATDIASLFAKRGILRLGGSKPSEEGSEEPSGKEGEE